MPHWSVMVFSTPKGWEGSEKWDNEQIAGTFRAHQVPIPVSASHMEYANDLAKWLKSYRPEELFDENGTIIDAIKELSPKGDNRMSVNPITNGGLDPKALDMPDWRAHAVDTSKRGTDKAQDMSVLGGFIADIMENNPKNFRIFGPDETKSNRLNKVFDVTNRQW